MKTDSSHSSVGTSTHFVFDTSGYEAVVIAQLGWFEDIASNGDGCHQSDKRPLQNFDPRVQAKYRRFVIQLDYVSRKVSFKIEGD